MEEKDKLVKENLIDDCIFCKIIKGEIPADIVYENDMVIGFKDINPVAKFHIVVIPKKHAKYIVEIHKAIQEITRNFKVEKDGYRIVTNIAKNAGQEVKHIHYHIIAGEKLRKYEIIFLRG